MDFSSLEKAKIALNLLDAHGTIPKDPFAAIAKLADNSYDAQAKNFHIDLVTRLVPQKDGTASNVTTLEFCDDGGGMSRTEALSEICFGHSEGTASHMGRYGTGLKASIFNLGRELLLLTKKNGIHTMMLISHKFHERNKIKNSVFVPCPSFDQYFQPYFEYNQIPSESQRNLDIAKHKMEMEVIGDFGPYGNLSVAELFSKIPTVSGTMIIVERLWRSLSGELDTLTNNDIRRYDKDAPENEKSLRSYLEVLYLEPTMKIHLRKQRVMPKKISSSWMAKHQVKVPMTTFKDVIKRCSKERNACIETLKEKREDVKSEIDEILKQGLPIEHRTSGTKDLRMELDKIIKDIEEAEKDNEIYLKDFQATTITFFIGVQTENRANNGIHFYANNRLVSWGHRAIPFFKNNKESIGITGYVNLDASVWTPTASQQKIKAEDMRSLCRKFNEMIVEYFEFFKSYWITTNLKVTGDDVVAKFWEKAGYQNPFAAGCPRKEITDPDAMKLIKEECPRWHVCTYCRVWRRDDIGIINGPGYYVTCKMFDSVRGCLGAPKAGDDEQFKMYPAAWRKIQKQMEKEKERAARRLTSSVTLTSSTSTPSSSTPSTSINHPISLPKEPATGRSGSSQVDGLGVVNVVSHPLESDEEVAPPTKKFKRAIMNAPSDQERVLNRGEARCEVSIDSETNNNERQTPVVKNVETVLEYLGTLPYAGIDIDRRLPVLDRLSDVARQIDEKKNKRKKQQRKN